VSPQRLLACSIEGSPGDSRLGRNAQPPLQFVKAPRLSDLPSGARCGMHFSDWFRQSPKRSSGFFFPEGLTFHHSWRVRIDLEMLESNRPQFANLLAPIGSAKTL